MNRSKNITQEGVNINNKLDNNLHITCICPKIKEILKVL